jgi:hypothetical protein
LQVLDFARSTMTFRIDLDAMPSRTLSHVPPYPMNNARAQLDSRCTVTERATGAVHTFVLGADCKTEQVGASADLWLEPNADFIPVLSNDAFMGIKTFAHADLRVRLAATGEEQPDRHVVPIATTFDRVHLDLVEREADPLTSAAAVAEAVLANDLLVGIHLFGNARYTAEVEYPVKVINANEREHVFQTDTGPILLPDLEREPADLLAGLDLAFTATNALDWAEVIVRARTPVGGGIEVFHYARTVRLDGIENAFYRIPPDAPARTRRVELPAAGAAPREGGPA